MILLNECYKIFLPFSRVMHLETIFFLRKASLPAIMWRQMGHLHLQFSLKIVDDRQKLTFCAQQYILCNVL